MSYLSYLTRLFRGRLNRENYAGCYVVVILFFLFLILAGAFLGWNSLDSFDDPFIAIPLGILVLPLYVRRLHDLGLPGWIIIITIPFPIAGLLMGPALLLLKGKNEANKYGEPDKPRSFIDALLNIPQS
jgi:uncharacterized membrane protein YhaH (DUF805 family)